MPDLLGQLNATLTFFIYARKRYSLFLWLSGRLVQCLFGVNEKRKGEGTKKSGTASQRRWH